MKDLKNDFIKAINEENVGKAIAALKELRVIRPEDPHQYSMQKIACDGSIADHNKKGNDTDDSTLLKCVIFSIAITILGFYGASFASWTLIITVPIALISYLILLIFGVFAALSTTNGGTIPDRIKTIENYLEYRFEDECVCLATSSHDYGDTIVFLSEKDMNNVCSQIIPQGETYHSIVKTNMENGAVSGWKDTLEIFIEIQCVKLKSVVY